MADPVVYFRAGKMIKDGSLLKPDPRKGLIRVIIDDQDLVHFQWIERNADNTPIGSPELDSIIFGGEAKFAKIERPGSRVFILKFSQEPDRDVLFWAQEPNADSDAANIQSVNSALSMITDGMEEDTPSSEQPTHPSSTPAACAGPPGSSATAGGIGASQLAAALGSILSGAMPAATQAQQRQAPGPALGEVLKADRIIPLLQNNPILVERLAPYVPEEHRTPEAMAEIMHSPQFKHQLDVLTHALATGQLDTSQFGLGPPAYGIKEFLNAIQREADKEQQQQHAPVSGDGEKKEQGQGEGDDMQE